MVEIQLYIEGKQVELFKDESITLTQSIQDIRDISKVFTDYTRTFNVPASKNNNKIFKHFHRFNIVGFDARRKVNASIYMNYKPFKDGKIKLEGVQLKNNEPHTYKLTFYGNIVNLKDTLGEDKLSNLTQLHYFNFQYSTANIKSYMENGLDVNFFTENINDAVIFPLITTKSRLIYDTDSGVVNTDTTKNIYATNVGSNYGVPISELKPAIRVYSIIKAIENNPNYNLTFSKDFFSKDNIVFYNLYLWLHNKEGELFQDQDAQYPVTGISNIIGDTSDISGFSSTSFVNKFNEDKSKRELRVNVNSSGSSLYNLVIKKDGEEFQRFDDLTGTTTNGTTTGKVTNIEIPNGIYTFFIETLVDSTYEIDITIEDNPNNVFKSKKSITATSGVAEKKVGGKTVSISSIIPDIKVIDFITGLFKMFNLTAFQNKDGVIVVKTLDTFFSSSNKNWDITKHVDKTQNTVDNVLPFKELEFKYKGTDSFLAKNHKDIANKEWGALSYKDGEKLDGQNYTIELPFEHFKYERLYVTDNLSLTENKTNLQYGYSVDESQSPYLGDPLLFYAAQPIVTPIAAIDLEGVRIDVNSPFMPLNSISYLNVFGTGIPNLNFNEEFDEYTGTPNQKTLFETYYKTYVKDMFDLRKRLTNVKAYLPMSMLFNLNLSDKITLFDDIYRINKITTNFETNQSTLELNNIFEEYKFNTLATVASLNVTADTILNFADDSYLRADATDLNDGFTIPDISTVIPNDIVVNNPTPIYDGVDLVVTPPTIAPSQVTVSTNTNVFFNYQVIALGKVGDNLEIMDEYGFLYSTTEGYLTSSNDVDVLKATAGVTTVPFVRDELARYILPTNKASYEKSGLTHPATYYWRFYARTNTGLVFPFADAISDVQSSSTVSTSQSQFNNDIGELLTGYIYTNLSTDFYFNVDFGDYNGTSGQYGQIIRNYNNIYTQYYIKKIVEWFTSQYDPIQGTWYSLSQSFKYLDATGQDGIFSMGDVSGAEIKYDFDQYQYYTIYIKGGASITGSQEGGKGYLFGNTGNLESTS